MKKRILLSAVTALLLLSNCMTVFADSQEKDYAVEIPVAAKPSPYEDAMLEPHRFNNLVPVFQGRTDFYAETSAPGRKNPVRAVQTYFDSECDEVAEEIGSRFFQYDAQGNLVSVNEFFPDGHLWTTEQYIYDAQSNLLSGTINHYWRDSSTTGGTTQYTYDKQGRLLSENDGEISKKYTYDALGNVLTYTYTDSSVNFKDKYTRDAKGNVLTYTRGSYKERHTLTYDAQGKLLIDYILHNDNPEGWNKAQYTYDAMGNRLTYDYIICAGEGLYYTVQYTYDAMGNLLTHTQDDRPQSYSLYTYPFSSIERYTYDAQGNLLTYNIDTEKYGSKYWSESKQYTYNEMGNLLTYTRTYTSHVGGVGRKPGNFYIEEWKYFYE